MAKKMELFIEMLEERIAPTVINGDGDGGDGGDGGHPNSGRGNGSEVPGADVDPGNSGGHNNGGD
jgi:hypothetical protein